jgi:thiosulfate/3-mercaptopyruvate sulfurtransferase
MPAEKQDPHANYLKQHLPGACFFDLEACTSKVGEHADLPHMLPSANQLASYLRELRIDPRDCIVVYDGKGIFSAPRIRFTLRHFGVDNVAVLEGGLKAWIAEGGETESGEVKDSSHVSAAPAASAISLSPEAGVVQSMASVRDNSVSSSPSFALVDARSKGRFEGTEPEPRPGLPSGHVEGARNVPFTSLLTADKRSGASVFLPPEELEKVFAAAQVDPRSAQPIVASCGSGVTACVVLMGLELVGRKTNVGLYDGSWTEWALRGNPIVTIKK